MLAPLPNYGKFPPFIVNVPTAISTLLVGIFITLTSLWVGQHNGLMPTAASAEAPQIDQLFNTMVAISTGLFLLVQGALLYSLFAFRRRQGDQTDAQPIHGNVPLEIVWTAIPSMIVLWLAIYSFDVYQGVNSAGGPRQGLMMAHNHGAPHVEAVAHAGHSTGGSPQLVSGTDADASEPLEIKVTGLQYAWLFYYDGSEVPAGDLHLPVNRPVNLTITANDVIHAFWVPEFRLKQDAIPGQETHLKFTPSTIGSYPIICAELCGAYHGAMKTRVTVESEADYEAWQQSRVVAAQSPESTLAAIPDVQEEMTTRVEHHLHEHHMAPMPGEIEALSPQKQGMDLATVSPQHPSAA